MSFPPGYKSVGFQYSDSKPVRTDAEKQRLFWKEHNEAITQKNVARGKDLREKNGDVPNLNDVYNLEADKQRQAERQAEIDASPYAIKWPLGMLPPQDIARKRAKWEHFHPGEPFPEELMTTQEKALTALDAKVQALNKELEQNNHAN